MKYPITLKKVFLVIGALGLMSLSPHVSSFNEKNYSLSIQPETDVYLCNGKYSKRYHYKSRCQGLKNCSTTIERTTLTEARSRGRTLCGYED